MNKTDQAYDSGDRPAIEITPEMIEAGVKALCQFDLADEPTAALESKASSVYRAMSLVLVDAERIDNVDQLFLQRSKF